MNINTDINKIYCINLERRTDRRKASQQQFDNAKIDVYYIAAIDGYKCGIQSPVKPGLLGCTLSHISVLNDIIANNHRASLIFEDDIELHSDFGQIMSKIIFPKDWDMIYLGGSHREKPTYCEHTGLLRITKTLTTHAYMISNNAAVKVLAEAAKLEKGIDEVYAEMQRNMNCYIVNPPVCWQSESFSDIENRVMKYPWLKTNMQ